MAQLPSKAQRVMEEYQAVLDQRVKEEIRERSVSLVQSVLEASKALQVTQATLGSMDCQVWLVKKGRREIPEHPVREDQKERAVNQDSLVPLVHEEHRDSVTTRGVWPFFWVSVRSDFAINGGVIQRWLRH